MLQNIWIFRGNLLQKKREKLLTILFVTRETVLADTINKLRLKCIVWLLIHSSRNIFGSTNIYTIYIYWWTRCVFSLNRTHFLKLCIRIFVFLHYYCISVILYFLHYYRRYSLSYNIHDYAWTNIKTNFRVKITLISFCTV